MSLYPRENSWLRTNVGNYKVWKEGKTNYTSSFEIIENQNYDIVLLEMCPCDTKDELRARERHYIEALNCVNNNLFVVLETVNNVVLAVFTLLTTNGIMLGYE